MSFTNSRPIVCTDASFAGKHAGIAVADRGGMLMAADVVRCTSSGEAETLAVLRAAEIARHARKQARIWTDCPGVVRRLEGKENVGNLGALFTELALICEMENLTVEWVDRKFTLSAHIASRQVRKAWEAAHARSYTYEPEVLVAA